MAAINNNIPSGLLGQARYYAGHYATEAYGYLNYGVKLAASFGTAVLATTPGREKLNRFVSNWLKLYGTPSEQTDGIIKTMYHASVLFDLHWCGVITSLFTARVGGVYRETDPELIESHGPIFDMRPGANGLNEKVYLKWEKWLRYEKIGIRKYFEVVPRKPTDAPDSPGSLKTVFEVYPDVEWKGEGKNAHPLPERTGITVLSYLMKNSPIEAAALFCFAYASFFSVISTYVPMFRPEFSLSNKLASIACSFGGHLFFKPEAWEAAIGFGLGKSDTVALSLAYGCSAWVSGKKGWTMFNHKTESRWQNGIDFLANGTLFCCHAGGLLFNLDGRKAAMIGGLLGVVGEGINQIRAKWAEKTLEGMNLGDSTIKNRNFSSNRLLTISVS